jgi:chromosome segregation ATPase
MFPKNRYRIVRMRHIMTIESASTQTGSTTEDAQDEKAHDDDKHDQSKDFSRALAKRAAEIEAKYSDYEELKSKAAKFDERESESKTDIDKLNERLATIEKERDELKASQEHRSLVDQVAKDTGLPPDIVSMLTGGDTETLKTNAESLKQLMEKQSNGKHQGAPNAAHHEGSRTPSNDMSPMDMLRDAYSE